jgi:hypothetical protein
MPFVLNNYRAMHCLVAISKELIRYIGNDKALNSLGINVHVWIE